MAPILISFAMFAMIHLLVPASVAEADTAQVLPKGVVRAAVHSKLYFPVDQQFDENGNVEDIAVNFNANLNSNVFPDLRLVEDAFGLPPGFANLGRSVVSFEYEFYLTDTYLAYGITDRLSAGIKIPYWVQKNKVKAELNTRPATVGKNAALNTLLPLNVPGTVPLTAKDVKNLLGRGLDIDKDGNIDIPGFQYKPFESWYQEGLADIEAGLKYLFFENPDWRMSVSAGSRFPTGEIDNPDDLVDYGFGSNAWALLFDFYVDYKGIKNLTLNGTFRYEAILPKEETLRIPRTVDEPITSNKEKVDQDLGDVLEFELEGNYEFLSGWNVSLLYKYGFSTGDKVSGNQGFNYQSLEDETLYREHVGIASLSYSTIPLYKAKKFAIPLSGTLSYRNRFAGENVLKSQYIELGLSVYF